MAEPVCPQCASDLVELLGCGGEQGSPVYRATLRCVECGHAWSEEHRESLCLKALKNHYSGQQGAT